MLRLSLAVSLLLVSLHGHAGLAIRDYPRPGAAPTVAHWPMAVQQGSDIVEVRFSPMVPEAFGVTRSLHGTLKQGDRLLFEDCAPILMDEVAADTLRGLLRAPVVNNLFADNTLPVEAASELSRYPVPPVDARYILAIKHAVYEGERYWHFAVQTVGGDMVLILGDRVYIPVLIAGVAREDGYSPHVWVPHPYFASVKELERALANKIAFREEFLRIAQVPDITARIRKLAAYVRPNSKDGDDYSYDAIQRIAESGAIGTAYLREHSAKPPMAQYLSFIIDEQYRQRDRAALPWMRMNVLKALDSTPLLPWPLRYCYPESAALRRAVAFLCDGAKTLAAMGDDQGVPAIRASIAWQMAQGREWWAAATPFTLTEKRQSKPFTSKPVPESDPLIVMSRAIMEDPLFRPYPSWTEEHTARVRVILRKWVERYDLEAIPGLLWVWAQEQDPDVFGSQRGLRPRLAREALKELLGQDLGTEALPYWNWYLEHVLKAEQPAG